MSISEFDEEFPLDRTRMRILRVDAAGEAGAISIYRMQLLWARWLPDEAVAFLRHALEHEVDHYRRFRAAMAERGVSICPGTFLWVIGGAVLGLFSAVGGLRGIMACTDAIEQTVHGHLSEQIAYLSDRDPALAQMIAEIQIEEEAHMNAGRAGYDPDCRAARRFTGFVAAVTEALIWLATFGDSARLKAAM